MQPHSSFDALARLTERLDADGRSVRRAEAVTATDEEGSLRATLEVSVPVSAASNAEPALEPMTATIDDGLCVTLRAPAFPDPAELLPADYPEVSTAVTDVGFDDGSVVATLVVTIESDGDDLGQSGGDPPNAESDSAVDDAASKRVQPPETDADETGLASRSDRSEHATATFGTGPRDVDDATSGAETGQAESRNAESANDERRNAKSANDESSGAGSEDGESSTGARDETTASLSAVRDGSVPPYEDTAYLETLYERCETFGEMSEWIEMDVSAETVRRYMIDAEIHTPTSYATEGQNRGAAASDRDPEENGFETPETPSEGDTDDDSTTDDTPPGDAGDVADPDPLPDEQLVADGIGLPEELTLQDVVDAVVDARTVHEVTREIGLGYDRTRHLLTQLNVLDLVVGRVSEGTDRQVSVETVTARIRQRTPESA